MIRGMDVIKSLNDFNASLSQVAFPFNMHVVPAELEEAANFLRSMLQNMKGDTIQIEDYSQMQQYMQASGMLKNITEFPPADDIKKITKWHRTKFLLPDDENIKIVLFKTVRETYQKWQAEGKYLKLHDDFIKQARYSIYEHRQLILSQPASKQEERIKELQALDIIEDPQKLFDKAKLLASNGLTAFMKLCEEKHAAKGNLIDHVYMDLLHDLDNKDYVQKQMVNGYLQIERWLTAGIDDAYRIDQKVIEETMNKYRKQLEDSGKVAAREKEAKAKKEDKEQSEKIKRLKQQADSISETDPELQEKNARLTNMAQTFTTAYHPEKLLNTDETSEFIQNMYGQQRTFNKPMTIAESSDLIGKTEGNLEGTEESFDDVAKMTKLFEDKVKTYTP